MKTFGALLCAFSLSLVSLPLFARAAKPAPTKPGTYKEWGQDIDQIEILKTFKMSDYDHVVVETFDTSAVDMKDEEVKTVAQGYTDTLTEALRDELKGAKVEHGVGKGPRTLIVRGKVLALNPGSRAKRALVGYGAGGTGTGISGEIVDAKSGEVLVKFSQERRSGGTWKPFGGSSVQVMRDAIHATGQDIAHILGAF